MEPFWGSCSPLGVLLGPSCGSFWCVMGPPWALVGPCLGSRLVSFGALVAFGVCAWRFFVGFLCCGGQVEAFRGVSDAVGSHFGSQKQLKTH